MRGFFETLLVLAVIVLAGILYLQNQTGGQNPSAPSVSGGNETTSDGSRDALQKLAEKLGADSAQCATASVPELVSIIEGQLLDSRSFGEAAVLTDEDWKNINIGLEFWPELIAKIEASKVYVEFNSGYTVIRLPKNEQ